MISIREHLPSRHTVAVALAKLAVRSRTPRPATTTTPGHTVAVVVATVAALAVAGSAFTRSFSALSDLAVMHDWPVTEAWILPVSLDGMIVVPTVAAAVRRDARWYAWTLLVAGTILSCAGNGVHAWLTTTSQIAVALAVIPPLVTFFAVHLAISTARRGRDTATDATASAGTDPTVAPDDHDKTRRDTDRDATPRPVRRLRVAPATPAQPVATRPAEPPQPATQQTLAFDVAPTDTTEPAKATPRAATRRRSTIDPDVQAEALRLVAERTPLREVAERTGLSKDKVWRLKNEHRDAVATATTAV